MPEPAELEPTRYDGLLAAIPVPVAAGVAAGWWSTLSTAAIGVGGVAAAALVVVSLFVVPPE